MRWSRLQKDWWIVAIWSPVLTGRAVQPLGSSGSVSQRSWAALQGCAKARSQWYAMMDVMDHDVSWQMATYFVGHLACNPGFGEIPSYRWGPLGLLIIHANHEIHSALTIKPFLSHCPKQRHTPKRTIQIAHMWCIGKVWESYGNLLHIICSSRWSPDIIAQWGNIFPRNPTDFSTRGFNKILRNPVPSRCSGARSPCDMLGQGHQCQRWVAAGQRQTAGDHRSWTGWTSFDMP